MTRPLRIGLINFGGIGDEILFAPAIAEIRRLHPQAHFTLILEDRSKAVLPLLPGLDDAVPMQVQGVARRRFFFDLVERLKAERFDRVISSGSSPFIPLALALSGTPYRVGFQTGLTSRLFCTTEAPLDYTCYAGQMYFSLATTMGRHDAGPTYEPQTSTVPQLIPPSTRDGEWAKNLIANHNPQNRPTALIHPGVSQVSVTKGLIKKWAPDRWASLIEQLSETHTVLLVGGPDDTETIAEILSEIPENLPHFGNLMGQTKSLPQLAALIASVDRMICCDSAPMHVAVGMGTPLVGLFGPTLDPKRLLPNDERFVGIQATGTAKNHFIDLLPDTVLTRFQHLA